jgi:hypothetical protein
MFRQSFWDELFGGGILELHFSVAHRLKLTQFIAEDQTNQQPIPEIGGWFFHQIHFVWLYVSSHPS